MEKISERIEKLEGVFKTLRLNTQPLQNHTDPNSIKDCWDEIDDLVLAIKSGIKRDVFITWKEAISSCRSNGNKKYDDICKELGTSEFHYKINDNPPR